MKNSVILKLFLAITILFSSVINMVSIGQENEFPKGKPILKTFFNFHSDFTKDAEYSAAEIKRAYLGYQYKIDKEYTLKTTYDISKPLSDSNNYYLTYLKTAQLSYNNSKWGYDIGMIGLRNFKQQEKFWGHRYIYKSFQDANKIAPSADLGITVWYKLGDKITIDHTFRNGEGYKQTQLDNSFNFGTGISIKPIDVIDLRFYLDYSEEIEQRSAISGFTGFHKEKIKLGLEYNYIINEKYVADQILYGSSFFASYVITEKWEIFARYDILLSNTLEGTNVNWNEEKDGSFLTAGFQCKPTKGIKCALNYQGHDPSSESKNYNPALFMNFEFSLK